MITYNMYMYICIFICNITYNNIYVLKRGIAPVPPIKWWFIYQLGIHDKWWFIYQIGIHDKWWFIYQLGIHDNVEECDFVAMVQQVRADMKLTNSNEGGNIPKYINVITHFVCISVIILIICICMYAYNNIHLCSVCVRVSCVCMLCARCEGNIQTYTRT